VTDRWVIVLVSGEGDRNRRGGWLIEDASTGVMGDRTINCGIEKSRPSHLLQRRAARVGCSPVTTVSASLGDRWVKH